jgi:hypothetical protein
LLISRRIGYNFLCFLFSVQGKELAIELKIKIVTELESSHLIFNL